MAPDSRKRKRIDELADLSASLATFVTTLKVNPDKPSLLDLAPEVRNLIYEEVLDGKDVLLRRDTSRPLACKSPLLLANKQVRQEAHSLMLFTANIRTKVTGWDFSHVVTFLNRLPEPELQTISSVNSTTWRTITITLVGSSCADDQTLPHGLSRWLNRTAHPTKKGAGIDFQYLHEIKQYRQFFRRLRAMRLKNEELSSLRIHLQATKEGRAKEELMKIVSALAA